MTKTHLLKFVILLTSITFLVFLGFFIYSYCKRRWKSMKKDIEIAETTKEIDKVQEEDLLTFDGGEDLTIFDILDAPGEVIGKSNYGTLYKALLLGKGKSVRLLRFLRPFCTSKVEDFDELIEFLGCIRHQNLVPLLGFYAGPRGEKLLVHPFYPCGNLAQFIRADGNNESHKWTKIYKISVGIAKGLDHLHSGLPKPTIHGNLKSKNILLDRNCEPYISDFSLLFLLNPSVGQEMLEALAAEGYKAPELIKMKEACEQTDIYSFGVILLELITGKEPINENPTSNEDLYLPNYLRNEVLRHRIVDFFHPKILGKIDDIESLVTEAQLIKFFLLAIACCSPSPSLRPTIKQIIWKLEEIGK